MLYSRERKKFISPKRMTVFLSRVVTFFLGNLMKTVFEISSSAFCSDWSLSSTPHPGSKKKEALLQLTLKQKLYLFILNTITEYSQRCQALRFCFEQHRVTPHPGLPLLAVHFKILLITFSLLQQSRGLRLSHNSGPFWSSQSRVWRLKMMRLSEWRAPWTQTRSNKISEF